MTGRAIRGRWLLVLFAGVTLLIFLWVLNAHRREWMQTFRSPTRHPTPLERVLDPSPPPHP